MGNMEERGASEEFAIEFPSTEYSGMWLLKCVYI